MSTLIFVLTGLSRCAILLPPELAELMRERKMVLTDKEVEVVWAALVSMVEENHQPQDNLTADQWVIAESLLVEVSAMMDKHDE